MLPLLRIYKFLCFFVIFGHFASAHGPIHEKIKHVTKKIDNDPSNPNLYVQRAGYYKIDRDFDKSFADYQTARNLDHSLKTIDYLVAELFYEFDYFNSALASLNSFQNQKINIAECYLLKAKIFDKLFMADSALYYGEAAYPHHTKPNTQYFVTVVNYVLFANNEDYARAKAWLEIGKQRLPYDLVIQEEYVNLALKFKDFQKAKALCEEKIPTLKRKEYWQFLLGTVYQEMNQLEQAKIQYNMALESISQLPRHHKNTSYIKTLKNQLLNKINSLQLTTQ
jgi:tetratricopeptide (TPR) repeat protein